MPPRLDASAIPETRITHLPEPQRLFCLLDCAAANQRAIVAQQRALIIGCRVGRQLAAARPSVMHTHTHTQIYIYGSQHPHVHLLFICTGNMRTPRYYRCPAAAEGLHACRHCVARSPELQNYERPLQHAPHEFQEHSPSTRALPKEWPEGSVRRMGSSTEKHSTGAATLVIHMDANVATNMLASSTACGLALTLPSTHTATRLAMKCFVKALAIAKPPSSSIIVCASEQVIVRSLVR